MQEMHKTASANISVIAPIVAGQSAKLNPFSLRYPEGVNPERCHANPPGPQTHWVGRTSHQITIRATQRAKPQPSRTARRSAAVPAAAVRVDEVLWNDPLFAGCRRRCARGRAHSSLNPRAQGGFSRRGGVQPSRLQRYGWMKCSGMIRCSRAADAAAPEDGRTPA